MKTGIGLDVVELERVERLLRRSPEFADRYFAPVERRACDGQQNPARAYAAVFAVKEAFLKALGRGVLGPVALADICVHVDGVVVEVTPNGSAVTAVGTANVWASIGYDGARAWAAVVVSPRAHVDSEPSP